MRVSRTILLAVIFLAAGFLSTPQAQTDPASNPAAVSSMEKKLQHIESNGKSAHPTLSPTKFTDQEINAYFAAGRVKLPAGVRSVNFQAQPGVVTGTARVDFDQIRSGRNSGNPLLSVFSGIHTVVVVAHARSESGQGIVHVDSVVLDDNEISPLILQIFVQKFIQPKYPNLGLDSRFALPARVDTATVGRQELTIIQK
jgi:hypothetical protein